MYQYYYLACSGATIREFRNQLTEVITRAERTRLKICVDLVLFVVFSEL